MGTEPKGGKGDRAYGGKGGQSLRGERGTEHISGGKGDKA